MNTDATSGSNHDEFNAISRHLLERISHLQKEIFYDKPTGPRRDTSDPSISAGRGKDYISSHNQLENNETRYLKDENEKLKGELAQAQSYVQHLSERNRVLTSENRRIPEAEAEAELLKKQLQKIRATLDRMPADEAVFQLRIEVLEERLHDMQQQNFDLRRQLAGMTPERHRECSSGKGLPDCEKCVTLLKQKTLQSRYMVAQATESRRQLDQIQNECRQLRDINEKLTIKLSDIEAKHEKDLKDAVEYRDLYRRNSERSTKWYKTQLEGFNNDISNLKTKLADLEKYLVKIQWTAEADEKQQALIQEMKKITQEAAVVANQVKHWRGVYE